MTTETQHRFWLSEVGLELFKAAFRPDPIPLHPFNVVIGRNGRVAKALRTLLKVVSTREGEPISLEIV